MHDLEHWESKGLRTAQRVSIHTTAGQTQRCTKLASCRPERPDADQPAGGSGGRGAAVAAAVAPHNSTWLTACNSTMHSTCMQGGSRPQLTTHSSFAAACLCCLQSPTSPTFGGGQHQKARASATAFVTGWPTAASMCVNVASALQCAPAPSATT